MLVHRWGISRKAVPVNITVSRTTALVMALCKLHHFCIDEKDQEIAKPNVDDMHEIALQGGFNVHAFSSFTSEEDFNVESTTYSHETTALMS